MAYINGNRFSLRTGASTPEMVNITIVNESDAAVAVYIWNGYDFSGGGSLPVGAEVRESLLKDSLIIVETSGSGSVTGTDLSLCSSRGGVIACDRTKTVTLFS